MQIKNLSKGWKIGLVLMAVFFLMRLFSSCSHKNDSIQVIRSVKVYRGNLEVKVTATGSVKPYNRVEIKAPIPGRVEEVLVKEGEEVKKGQILAQMSSTERAALLDAARAQGGETMKRWEEAYKMAPLLAPLDGTIIVRSVEPGQTVTTADPVLVLSDRLIVEALVDETDLAQIKLDQKAEIQLDAYPKEAFLGKVYHIKYESTLVNNVNVYAVDVLLEKVPPSFLSGMSANITFIVKEKKGVLLVPSEAIVEWPKNVPNPDDAQFAVYGKVFGGKLVPLAVRIGDSNGLQTEIAEGLKEGQEIQIVQKKQKEKSVNPFGMGGAPKKTSGQGQGRS
ncbi:MAG TPA: efflux RND transporter periplasmic adaptor subunit [Candidatus Omnitrophota bacterium]|nr:efflux RND transporter periplasmic adaptor subunit [Candidatus Omnitrophota bacterium]HPS37358.1 efflux RND transporter periplasmic adaptor subunit [Candidatus Omnitrophota bacterium]